MEFGKETFAKMGISLVQMLHVLPILSEERTALPLSREESCLDRGMCAAIRDRVRRSSMLMIQ